MVGSWFVSLTRPGGCQIQCHLCRLCEYVDSFEVSAFRREFVSIAYFHENSMLCLVRVRSLNRIKFVLHKKKNKAVIFFFNKGNPWLLGGEDLDWVRPPEPRAG